MLLVITSLKDIEIKRVLKVCFWSAASFFAVHMILILLGVLASELSYSLDEGIRKRYGLGYLHPNPAHSVVVGIIFLALIAYKEKLKTCHYILLVAFNLIIYHFTDSRTGMLLACLGTLASRFLTASRVIENNAITLFGQRNIETD